MTQVAPVCVGCNTAQEVWLAPPEGAQVWPPGSVYDGICPECGRRNVFISGRVFVGPAMMLPGDRFRPPASWHQGDTP